MQLDHDRTPLLEAVEAHLSDHIIPFHVPGHKHGIGAPDLIRIFGDSLMRMDLNSMEDVDDYINPVSAIRDAETLAADAFGAEHAFFLTNGTTSGIHAMMLATLRPGDTVILPRNVHKSVISGLILTGAIPHYVHAEYHAATGIQTTVTVESIRRAFQEEPHAAAVLIINPSYYGFAPELRDIVTIAHQHDALVLVDEAHGAHMGFHEAFPVSAMAAGADLSASSIHKTAGSLTQSSILLMQGQRIPHERVKQSLNLIRSTSGSYPLLISLDVARRALVQTGRVMLDRVINLAATAAHRLTESGAYDVIQGDFFPHASTSTLFDPTKLGLFVRRLGMTGFEMERQLRTNYQIQIELAQANTIMAILTMADTESSINSLVNALNEIADGHTHLDHPNTVPNPSLPDVIVTPRDAYYQPKHPVTLTQAIGEISGEMIMAYPPGIPIICPGERITADIIDHIRMLKAAHATLQGNSDPRIDSILVLGRTS